MREMTLISQTYSKCIRGKRRKDLKEALKDFTSQEWVKCVEKGATTIREGQARKFFRWVERITKYKGRQNLDSVPIRDDEGQLQYDPSKIAELWAEHFEKLFSGSEENNRGMNYWEARGGTRCPATNGWLRY